MFGWRKKKHVEKKDTINLRDHAWWRAAASGSAGVRVTHKTALDVATVLACCRVIAEDVAKLPLRVYQRQGNRKLEAADNRWFRSLSARPNPWQTSFEFRETLTIHCVLTGNAFALKAGTADSGQLIPIVPELVRIVTDADEPAYEVRDTDGKTLGVYGPGQIFHLRGPSWDTHTGLDATKQAREAIGLSMATERSQGRLHSNGARPSGILTTPNPIKNKEVIERLRQAWEDMYTGVDNAYRTAILDNDFKFQQISMSGVDAQHLETRKHQIEEIARAFKVFPQMIGHHENTATYASAEAFFSAHFRHTIWPWLERWQQALDRDLLDRDGPLFVEFRTSDFSKAALKDRADSYRSFVEMGIYTRNEIRALEGLEPLPGLDEPLTPMNMSEGGNGTQDGTA